MNQRVCKLQIYTVHISCTATLKHVCTSAYHFLPRAQHSHLAKTDVKRRALQSAVRLTHHNDINTAREGGRVQASVQLLHLHENLTGQLTHVVHGLTLKRRDF